MFYSDGRKHFDSMPRARQGDDATRQMWGANPDQKPQPTAESAALVQEARVAVRKLSDVEAASIAAYARMLTAMNSAAQFSAATRVSESTYV